MQVLSCAKEIRSKICELLTAFEIRETVLSFSEVFLSAMLWCVMVVQAITPLNGPIEKT